ncbi:Serine phosphatase RsbU, regulator of sigma subunit [Streptomyces sp. DvalAA-14]|uniref:PP2C family protein-serine/threonine phosphatase n=1 Tax=unclassified Streptomyces TaxID=2593676 RepID=UPI00081B97CF|nr:MULTISPECIES: SpoIIE family protein phosphatase [unclassified Streptomyces]MYS23369.1 SpoIIE family protein phosphatase [Streptomyces sp. SID4948]SCE32277.1 Serine phosphatase RsbU, regulator of sigma subunit [Streptomyces sp. DvalAA-14]
MSAVERDTERPAATVSGAGGRESVPTPREGAARVAARSAATAEDVTEDTARDAAHGPGRPPPVVLPRQRQDSAGAPALTLLVIGEDPAGAFTAPWFQEGNGPRIRILRARNLTAAGRLLTDDVHCILLDLPDPPDATDTLRQVLRLALGTAVLVLTDGADEGQAAEVVRIGAQDHLSRHEINAPTVIRAVRYAVERKRADLAQRQLTETRLLAQENSRLERGLLPTPLLEGATGLRFAARYRPGRSRALLGGDFYDTVRTPDGTVHAMIGDVCGHGPDAAALGVELRIAWRALTFAGIGGETLLRTLQEVLEHERDNEETFATLSVVDIAPDGRSADLFLAGHPAPLLTGPGRVPRLLPYEEGGPALGLLEDAAWTRIPVRLDDVWSLMLYTDGLIEGRIGEGRQRLGQDGMVGIVTQLLADGLRGEELLDAAVTRVRELNGGELTDDVAVVLLERRG